MQKSARNILLFISALAMSFLFYSIEAKAAGESVNFGSESYEWQLNTSSPIGIYAHSDQLIQEVTMDVVYDSEMLEYVSGGELIEEGTVRVQSTTSSWQEFRQMLNFTPRIAGNSKITLQNITIINASGETVNPAETSVTINTPIPSGAALDDIIVNGTSVSDFSSTTTNYRMEVSAETKTVELTLSPSEVQVEVSDTTLATGLNIINITTSNANGEQARYVLSVNKAEGVPLEETQEDQGIEQEQETSSVVTQADQSKTDRNQILLWSVMTVLVLLLLGLIIIKVRLSRQSQQIQGDQGQDKRTTSLSALNSKRRPSKKTSDSTESRPNDENMDKDKKKANEYAIVVKNVTMEFRREKDEATSIKEMVIRTVKGQRSYEWFRALDNVSFKIRKGDVVGVIGTNGSGKSTILKIISGVLAPTKGKVEVDKKRIQLLTLGTGFDFELTGRENVYLNGAIIGYTKEFIDDKYDDIVKFAELEGFMEEKVRNYSSGMVSRLGFAIATIGDAPEILILDEVLSVGDMFFRKKSEARIKELIHGGSTVLIVSHSTSVITNNCNRAVWIEKGRLKAVGNPKKVCDAYEKMNVTN